MSYPSMAQAYCPDSPKQWGSETQQLEAPNTQRSAVVSRSCNAGHAQSKCSSEQPVREQGNDVPEPEGLPRNERDKPADLMLLSTFEYTNIGNHHTL